MPGLETIPASSTPPPSTPDKSKRRRAGERYLTQEERYRIEQNKKKEKGREQKVMNLTLNYSRALKKYGVPTSLEDGTADMDWYAEMYGTEAVATHYQFAQRIKRLKVTKGDARGVPEYHKNPEYLEKIVPISLQKSTGCFLDEISDIKKFYQRYDFNAKEQDIFNQLLDLVPYDMAVQIAALYDDVKHGVDFSIVGDFPLCGVDVTTDIKSQSKAEKIMQHNENSTSIFYGLEYQEENKMYVPKPSIANFPLLYLGMPNKIIPDIIDKIAPSMDEITEGDLSVARYITAQLSQSLSKVARKTRFNRQRIGNYIEKAEKELVLPQNTLTTPEKVEQALAERFECVDILRAFFYCTDQFFSKKLYREPQVEIPISLLD